MTDHTHVILGKLGSAFGVQGWLNVNSSTSPKKNILNYSTWQIQHQGEWLPFKVSKSKLQNKSIVVKLEGIDDRDIARTYTNDLIAIFRDELPEVADNEFYWVDLIGCRMLHVDGTEMGIVRDMYETGSNDVFIVIGAKEYWVPYLDDVIKSIDIEKKVIVVDWELSD